MHGGKHDKHFIAGSHYYGRLRLSTATDKGDETIEYCLAWLLSRERAYLGFALEAREQKRNASGGWSKGESLSMKKVAEMAESTSYFSAQDRRVAAHIAPDRYTGSYSLSNRGWLAMVGAPNVSWKDSGVAVELVAAEPELRVSKKTQGRAGQNRILAAVR